MLPGARPRFLHHATVPPPIPSVPSSLRRSPRRRPGARRRGAAALAGGGARPGQGLAATPGPFRGSRPNGSAGRRGGDAAHAAGLHLRGVVRLVRLGRGGVDRGPGRRSLQPGRPQPGRHRPGRGGGSHLHGNQPGLPPRHLSRLHRRHARTPAAGAGQRPVHWRRRLAAEPANLRRLHSPNPGPAQDHAHLRLPPPDPSRVRRPSSAGQLEIGFARRAWSPHRAAGRRHPRRLCVSAGF
jgi:hypothetical protein